MQQEKFCVGCSNGGYSNNANSWTKNATLTSSMFDPFKGSGVVRIGNNAPCWGMTNCNTSSCKADIKTGCSCQNCSGSGCGCGCRNETLPLLPPFIVQSTANPIGPVEGYCGSCYSTGFSEWTKEGNVTPANSSVQSIPGQDYLRPSEYLKLNRNVKEQFGNSYGVKVPSNYIQMSQEYYTNKPTTNYVQFKNYWN